MAERLLITQGVSGEAEQGALSTDVHRLAGGAMITLVGRVAGRGLHLLNQVALARLLGPDQFGLYAIGWTVLQMASLIAPLGLHQGVIRYGSQYWRRDRARFKSVLGQSLKLVAITGLTIGATMYVLAPRLASRIFHKPDLVGVFHGFAIALVLAALLRVAAAITRISQRMQFSVLSEDTALPATQLALILVLVGLGGWGLRGAIFAAGGAFALAVALAFFFIWKLFAPDLRGGSAIEFRTGELLAFSLPTSLAGIFAMLTLRVDRLLVGYFLPASEVGIYQAASQAAMLSAIILSAFNAIFSPMIARLHHQGQMERLDELFKVSTKWGLYASLPLFLVLVVAPRQVMTVAFGQPYAKGAIPMLIMAGGQLINAGTGAVGFLLIMTGHQKQWLAVSSASFLINIALGWVLIPRLGLNGAAVAVAVAVAMLFLSGLAQVRRLLGLWPYDGRYIKGVVAGLGSLVALLLFRYPLQAVGVSLFWLAGLIIVAVGSFAGLLVLFRLEREDKDLIQMLVERTVRATSD